MNRASRRFEESISRSFSTCGRKSWVPSTCAGDYRELLRVPLRRQGYCGVGRGLSGLQWFGAMEEGEYSLEGLMLKLKLQYFGHLIGRTDSFEKTLMLGKIEGWRRRG